MPKEKVLNKKEVAEILAMKWPDFCKRVSGMGLRNLNKLLDAEVAKDKVRASYYKRLRARINRESKK